MVSVESVLTQMRTGGGQRTMWRLVALPDLRRVAGARSETHLGLVLEVSVGGGFCWPNSQFVQSQVGPDQTRPTPVQVS